MSTRIRNLLFIAVLTHSISAPAANEPVTGMVLSAEVVLSADTPLPGGMVLPAGTLLPAGTVLPAGTILPLTTPIADDAPAEDEVAAEVAAEPVAPPKPAPLAEPTLSTKPLHPVALPPVDLKSHAVPAMTAPTEVAEPVAVPEDRRIPDVEPSASDEPAAVTSSDAGAVEGVPYLSGGIGSSERAEMSQVKDDYNLHLLFAVQGSGAYLADIRVRIADANGTTLLAAVSKGPWFYAKLAPGQYHLSADKAGQVQTAEVRVPASGTLQAAFYWLPSPAH